MSLCVKFMHYWFILLVKLMYRCYFVQHMCLEVKRGKKKLENCIFWLIWRLCQFDHGHTSLTIIILRSPRPHANFFYKIWPWPLSVHHGRGHIAKAILRWHGHTLIFMNFVKMATLNLPCPSVEFLREFHLGRGHLTTTMVHTRLLSLKFYPINSVV